MDVDVLPLLHSNVNGAALPVGTAVALPLFNPHVVLVDVMLTVTFDAVICVTIMLSHPSDVNIESVYVPV